MSFKDFSFEFNGEPIHFSITSHPDKDLVHFNSTGRIGQVIEVIQPPEILSSQLSDQQRVEYELKSLLGNPELVWIDDFDVETVQFFTARRWVIHS